ncbi:hypothetical protein J421_4666 (plasmid) [Gemmatirosa kalamazoonensis]|uniref:Uncharacterized protein n=1 Tax=Gemmatirosa kalamazoonensis TaxID=861299 RepID=W0RN86_9BACT|nr:hypothetical protein [Gemmatirosa kalamazoonensis]AHG92133.1 hypothetical protein J421_4598 [Gemmatirosa kalamazoonensis]AHG92201.1 hypothetical protein J421_4666 [Gemmatirosa kalamazoonensis]
MPLPAVIDSLDSLPEALRESLRGEYVSGADGKLHLTILDGDKSTTFSAVSRSKADVLREKKQLEDSIRPLRDVIGDRPVEQVRALLESGADRDKAIAAAIAEVREKELKPATEQLSRFRSELEVERLDRVIDEAIDKAQPKDAASKQLARLAAKQQVKLKDGTKPVVLQPDGTESVYSVEQWVAQDLRAQYPGLFAGSAASGTGATADAARGTVDANAKTVKVGDNAAFGANLDAIARGQVKLVE